MFSRRVAIRVERSGSGSARCFLPALPPDGIHQHTPERPRRRPIDAETDEDTIMAVKCLQIQRGADFSAKQDGRPPP